MMCGREASVMRLLLEFSHFIKTCNQVPGKQISVRSHGLVQRLLRSKFCMVFAYGSLQISNF